MNATIGRVAHEKQGDREKSALLAESAGTAFPGDAPAEPGLLHHEVGHGIAVQDKAAGPVRPGSCNRPMTGSGMKNLKQQVLFGLIMALLVLAMVIMPVAQLPSGNFFYVSLMGTLFALTAAWLLGA